MEESASKTFGTQVEKKNKRPKGLNGHQYQILYTDFLSMGLIFAYQLPHHRIDNKQQRHRKAALDSLNTIAINVMYIDRVEDNACSLY